MSFKLLYSLLCLALAITVQADNHAGTQSGVIKQIVRQVEGAPGYRVAGETLYMPLELQEYYAGRDYHPAWGIYTAKGRRLAREFLTQIKQINDEGLFAEDYHYSYFKPLIVDLDIVKDDDLFDGQRWRGWDDVLLTDALLHYLRHLTEGRVPPDNLQEAWSLRKEQVALTDLLDEALGSERMGRVLDSLQPAERDYIRLQKALARYRDITVEGGWPQIGSGPSVRPGESDPRLQQLRIRLHLSGDLSEVATDAPPKLLPQDVAALKRFQKRHGLRADGVLGKKTLEALNVPASERLRQVELNLERWRWLPQRLGKRYMLVNIADYRVHIYERGKRVLSIPVVVGSNYRKTPVFSSKMRYLEFAPYWTVPPTILYEDKLPLIKRDLDYLERNHYELVKYGEVLDPEFIAWEEVREDEKNFPARLRQRPGPWNALGRVKFMFPNEYAVYLHDTPNRSLFWREQRSFSSGCIRVQRPVELATFLLEEQGWERQDVLDAMQEEEPWRVNLKRPLPVYVLYWTAWVDDKGLVHFRDDVYGRDAGLDRALQLQASTNRIDEVAHLVSSAEDNHYPKETE